MSRTTLTLATLTALLLFAPSASAAGTPLDVLAQDSSGETRYKTLDILGILGSADEGSVSLAIRLAEDPGKPGPESATTATNDLRYRYAMDFEVRSTADDAVYSVFLWGSTFLWPDPPAPGSTPLGAQWSYGMTVRPGALDAEEPQEPMAVDINATLDDGLILWTLDRAHVHEQVGLLGPESAWTVSALAASSRMESFVIDAVARWGARQTVSDSFGSDRAPDTGYATILEVPAAHQPSSTVPTPAPAEEDARPPVWREPEPQVTEETLGSGRVETEPRSRLLQSSIALGSVVGLVAVVLMATPRWSRRMGSALGPGGMADAP